MGSDQKFYDQHDMLVFFQDSLIHGDKEAAMEILYVMAESCPLRNGACLVSKFCPDREFYKKNGVLISLGNESSADNTIQATSKEESSNGHQESETEGS